MPVARDIHGTAFKNGSAILLARIVDTDGNSIVQADLTAIRYSIYELDPARPDHLSVVSGHSQVELVVADVIHDTLQLGNLWSVDDVGFNFRHEVDITTSAAFPKAGSRYQVRYQLTPTSGQNTIVRFQLAVT